MGCYIEMPSLISYVTPGSALASGLGIDWRARKKDFGYCENSQIPYRVIIQVASASWHTTRVLLLFTQSPHICTN